MTHKFFGIFRLDIKTYKSPSPSSPRLPNKKNTQYSSENKK